MHGSMQGEVVRALSPHPGIEFLSKTARNIFAWGNTPETAVGPEHFEDLCEVKGELCQWRARHVKHEHDRMWC